MLTLPSRQRDEHAPTFTSTKEYIHTHEKDNDSKQILIDITNTKIFSRPWVGEQKNLSQVCTPTTQKMTQKKSKMIKN